MQQSIKKNKKLKSVTSDRKLNFQPGPVVFDLGDADQSRKTIQAVSGGLLGWVQKTRDLSVDAGVIKQASVEYLYYIQTSTTTSCGPTYGDWLHTTGVSLKQKDFKDH